MTTHNTYDNLNRLTGASAMQGDHTRFRSSIILAFGFAGCSFDWAVNQIVEDEVEILRKNIRDIFGMDPVAERSRACAMQ